MRSEPIRSDSPLVATSTPLTTSGSTTASGAVASMSTATPSVVPSGTAGGPSVVSKVPGSNPNSNNRAPPALMPEIVEDQNSSQIGGVGSSKKVKRKSPR